MSYKNGTGFLARGLRVLRATTGARLRKRSVICATVLVVFAAASAIADIYLPNLFPFLDPTGISGTYTETGRMDLSGPFFQSLGTNGRSCGTCHTPRNGFGLSATDAQLRYLLSHGKDPLFAQIDGSVCPTGPIDNSLVRMYGLIRIGLTVPSNAQYTITAAEDPYGCAITFDSEGNQMVSVYRRPIPSTNLHFISSVMFDGRETVAPLNEPQTYAANLKTDLKQQAFDAIMGHAQASEPPTANQLEQVVDFEMSLNSAQLADFRAGDLARSANGGAQFLATQDYYPGINDSLGGDPEGHPFDPHSFTIFTSFENSQNPQQASIARGEEIFNTHPLTISNVPGLTTGAQQIVGTCSTCHDSPNVGSHSMPLPLDVGTSHAANFETDPNIAAALNELQPARVPVYQLVCTQGPLAGQIFYSSDPGKALISGQCSDIGRGKGPILRSLASRAPYFHNGAAANLHQVVNFYDKRFQIGLSPQQVQDLVNFLQSL